MLHYDTPSLFVQSKMTCGAHNLQPTASSSLAESFNNCFGDSPVISLKSADIRITLMYYINCYTFLEEPEKDWNKLLEEENAPPSLPSLFY